MATEAKLVNKKLSNYEGFLAVTDDGMVLMGKRAFGARRITNVGGGTVDAKDEVKGDAAMREFQEETFNQVGFVLSYKCQVYERVGTQVHSFLYRAEIKGKVDLEQLNATAAKHLAKLEQLKADPTTTPLALEECKRYTEFDAFYLVSLDKLETAAHTYYSMSDKGTKATTPVHLDGVGNLEPSFCCLLANPIKSE